MKSWMDGVESASVPRAMQGALAGLVVLTLASGCMWGRENRRAEAARAAERERDRGQQVEVNIDVERPVVADDVERQRRERPRAPAGEVAAAMIAPHECPMLEGAEVSLVDLGDGAALEFVADEEGEVQIVRDRVLNIAVKHQRAMQERLSETSPHEADVREGAGRHAQEPTARQRQARMEADIDPMPSSHVAVVDVDRGARIIFVPVDRSDLDRLNDALEERAAYMREGSCPANLMSMQVPDDFDR